MPSTVPCQKSVSFSRLLNIVAGFLGHAPVLFKISGGDVWSCDDIAVSGSGTLLREAALSNREQHMPFGLNRTLYNVFEAKTLAQRVASENGGTSLSFERRSMSRT